MTIAEFDLIKEYTLTHKNLAKFKNVGHNATITVWNDNSNSLRFRSVERVCVSYSSGERLNDFIDFSLKREESELILVDTSATAVAAHQSNWNIVKSIITWITEEDLAKKLPITKADSLPHICALDISGSGSIHLKSDGRTLNCLGVDGGVHDVHHYMDITTGTLTRTQVPMDEVTLSINQKVIFGEGEYSFKFVEIQSQRIIFLTHLVNRAGKIVDQLLSVKPYSIKECKAP